MKKMKAINVKRIVSILLAVLMVAMYTIPQISEKVIAADQIPNGSEGIMAYHHSTGSDPKYVDYNYPGATPGYTEAPDIFGQKQSGNPWYVYCINQQRNARDYEKWTQHFRWRWNLGANRWLLDNSKNQNINDGMSNPAGSEAYDALARILYYGYPNNYGNGNYTYDQTQDAVEALMCGNGAKQNDLYNTAMNSTIGVNGNLYMFIADSDSKQIVQNTVGLAVWGAPSTPDEPKPDTPDKPADYDDTPSERSATVDVIGHKTINGKDEGFDRDESKHQFAFRLYVPSKFNGSPAADGQDGHDGNGGYHTRILPRNSQDEAQGDIGFGSFRFTLEDAGKEFKFRAREIKPSEGLSTDNGSMPMPSATSGMVYDSTEYEFTIKVEKVTDNGVDTIKLTCNGKDVTDGIIEVGTWDNRTPELKTTATAGSSTGTESAPARVKGDEAFTITTVTDKIDYSNLNKGATYKVSGTLMDVTDIDSPKEVATASEEKKAEDSSGTWEITFNNVELKPGHVYVVYEEAQNTEDADDRAEHRNPEDLAQTVVVGGKLKTTVKAGDKTGSENKAAELTAAEAKSVTEVTDTIDYEGLQAGDTYTVKGTLMDLTDNKEVAIAEEEKVADAESGSWEITFKNVKLEAGHKYVVFEEAQNVDDEADYAEHKDENDLAQTIVVEKEPEENPEEPEEENGGEEEEEEPSNNAGNEAAILSVAKTAEVETASPGDVVTYTITIENTGEGDATGVKVRDTMNKNLEYVSDDFNGVNSGRTVDWLVDIPAGGTLDIEIQCRIKEDASGKVVNNVKIMNPDIFGSVTEDADEALVGLDDDNTDDNDTPDEGNDEEEYVTVKTGDMANIATWIILAVLALTGFMILRKRDREK